ncbi:hypothetical protein GCM10027517_22220 [Phycicoccus ginsengisoli]
MIDTSWRIPENEQDELAGTPRPLLGTLHYLRNSLRRLWRTWVGLAAVGALLGLAVVVYLPPGSAATVTILMVHPADLDPAAAMATDLSLLNTREVAQRTVEQLGLAVSPEAFQGSVSAQATTAEILTVTVTGASDADAVHRSQVLSETFLRFRREQLGSITAGIVDGYQSRINALQAQIRGLDQGAQSQSTDVVTQRAQLAVQVAQLEQASDDATMGLDAALASTHVLDAAHPVTRSHKKTLVLDVGSGLLGGLALGVAIVFFRALTTDRLRRRHDIALALDVPVAYSVASAGTPARGLARLFPRRRGQRGWRGSDLDLLVEGAASTVIRTGTSRAPHRVAVAAVGNAAAAAAVVHGLGEALRQRGFAVVLVDLSRSGALARAPRRVRRRGEHEAGTVEAYRPAGSVPELARGPLAAGYAGGATVSMGDEWGARWDAADVVLVLAEVNPGVDAESLGTWVDQVIPLVTAGRATPELLETTGELLRAAGLSLPYVMLVGADETDESLGVVEPLALDTPDVVTQA